MRGKTEAIQACFESTWILLAAAVTLRPMVERTQRRLAAIVSADVVGYSRLMGVDEAGTLRRLNAHRAELIDGLIASHGGRIVKTTGDGLLLEFPSVVAAVECVVAVQEGMSARNAGIGDTEAICFRIGVHLGDVIVEGDDIFGDGVNIAARLQEICQAGGVTISRNAHDSVEGRIEAGFVDGGDQELKNIARPVQVWRWSPNQPRPAETAEIVLAGPEEPLPLPDKPSIAVLPFDNMSGDPEQEYFSDGISEDLTTALSRFDGLFVIARNSAFTYKGAAVDVKRVGQELGVRYVLEGSVRRAGTRVRVNAQLIDAAADRHVWAERFDRQIDDIFELQDDIVASIAATVGPEITLAEIERARHKRPETLDVWDYYLRAIAALHKMTPDDVAEAIVLLENAIKAEPEFGNAYALLAQCHLHMGMQGWIKPARQGFEAASRLAQEAVHLTPSSPETNQALALVLWATGDSEQAITAARRAIDLNPNYAEAYVVLALALTFYGDLEGGLAACEKAARANPRDARGSRLYDAMGHAYFMLGDYEQAIEVSKKGLLQDPSLMGALVSLAGSYAFLDRQAEAKRYIDELLRLVPRYSLHALRKNPWFVQPEHIEKLIEGLRRAGLPE